MWVWFVSSWGCFSPHFQYGKPAYFDVSVHHPLQDSLLVLSAAATGVTAERGEADKDYHYEAVVRATRGSFCSFGGGVPRFVLSTYRSLRVLRNIALHTTSKSGAPSTLAFYHFLEQLSVCLWRYNSRMLLHHLSLLPSSPWWELDTWSHLIICFLAGGFAILSHQVMYLYYNLNSFPGGFCHSEPPGVKCYHYFLIIYFPWQF